MGKVLIRNCQANSSLRARATELGNHDNLDFNDEFTCYHKFQAQRIDKLSQRANEVVRIDVESTFVVIEMKGSWIAGLFGWPAEAVSVPGCLSELVGKTIIHDGSNGCADSGHQLQQFSVIAE